MSNLAIDLLILFVFLPIFSVLMGWFASHFHWTTKHTIGMIAQGIAGLSFYLYCITHPGFGQ